MWGWEGLYGRPRGGVWSCSSRWKPDEQDAGDHKGPPFRSPPLSPLRLLMGLVLG